MRAIELVNEVRNQIKELNEVVNKKEYDKCPTKIRQIGKLIEKFEKENITEALKDENEILDFTHKLLTIIRYSKEFIEKKGFIIPPNIFKEIIETYDNLAVTCANINTYLIRYLKPLLENLKSKLNEEVKKVNEYKRPFRVLPLAGETIISPDEIYKKFIEHTNITIKGIYNMSQRTINATRLKVEFSNLSTGFLSLRVLLTKAYFEVSQFNEQQYEEWKNETLNYIKGLEQLVIADEKLIKKEIKKVEELIEDIK